MEASRQREGGREERRVAERGGGGLLLLAQSRLRRFIRYKVLCDFTAGLQRMLVHLLAWVFHSEYAMQYKNTSRRQNVPSQTSSAAHKLAVYCFPIHNAFV